MRKVQGTEMFQLVDGQRSDAELHEEILASRGERADRFEAEQLVLLAVAAGYSRADAERLWGYDSPSLFVPSALR